MIELVVKGADTLKRDIKNEAKRTRYAMNLAVRVEGFRLMRLLKKEIRDGAPGGRQFPELSVIARKRLHRGRNEPLRRLALGVRYDIKDHDPVEMHIGWTGSRVSRRWKHLARVLQEGFETSVTPGIRKYLAGYGSGIRDRASVRYFMLKKSTHTLRTPARPIIDPFWRRHERDARRNIVNNFRRKMKGERI